MGKGNRAVRRQRRSEPLGIARTRAPIFNKRDDLWLARYVDLVGKERQAGRFARKRDAAAASQAAVDDLNLKRKDPESVPKLDEYLEDEWTETFPRRQRTDDTNEERIRRYILPHLPAGGSVPLDVISRADLLAVQGALLKLRLSKTTIDGAFASLSALLRDCQSIGMIAENHAKGLRVRSSDRRLDPSRPGRERRAVPLEELYAFFDVMEERFPDYLCLAWTPLVSGMRPGELFAADRRDRSARPDDLRSRDRLEEGQHRSGDQDDPPCAIEGAARAAHAVPRCAAGAHGGAADAAQPSPVPVAAGEGLEPGQLPDARLAPGDAPGEERLHAL